MRVRDTVKLRQTQAANIQPQPATNAAVAGCLAVPGQGNGQQALTGHGTPASAHPHGGGGNARGRRLLAGQRALVTGGNLGAGPAIVEALALAGARVAVHYTRGADEAQRLVTRITAGGGQAIAIQSDVGQEHQVHSLFAEVIDAYGSLDILVNHAELDHAAAIVDLTLEDWEQVMRVNLTGQFLCAREAVREFIRRGVVPELSQSAGKIISISSVHDVIPRASHAHYAASKAGAMMLIKTLAQELASQKIRVNGVSPGIIRGTLHEAALHSPAAEADLLRRIPYGRLGTPQDIARAITWLVSDEADYVTGTTLYVDGGMTLYPGFEQSA